ncbi:MULTISPECIES: hypothetical protein, partial [Micromonospora]
IHLAELLRAGLHGEAVPRRPEQSWGERPQPPSAVARWTAAGLVAAAALAPVAALVRRWSR